MQLGPQSTETIVRFAIVRGREESLAASLTYVGPMPLFVLAFHNPASLDGSHFEPRWSAAEVI